eukprot:5195417-Pyramimonas_sp.AAC.1
MGLDYVLDPQAVSVSVERPRWDLDTLMLALRKGIGRRDFLEAVEARIHGDSELCDRLLSLPTADQAFDYLNDMLIQIGQQFFGAEA